MPGEAPVAYEAKTLASVSITSLRSEEESPLGVDGERAEPGAPADMERRDIKDMMCVLRVGVQQF